MMGGLWWIRCTTVAAFLCSIALLFLTMRANDAERQWSNDTMHAVHIFALAQRSLQRDLLNARVGILRSYDPINRDLERARGGLDRLVSLSPGADIRALLGDSYRRVARQEMLVENFKTNNALLQNALASFTMADIENRGGAKENQLAAGILKLTLDTSPEAVSWARASIEALSKQGEAAEHLRANASLLLTVLPAVDQSLHDLRALRLDERADRLRFLVSAESDVRRGAVTRWVVGLILFAVVTIALIAIWMIMLRLHNRDLQRLAENEHLNATVANLLIDARLFDGKGRLHRVLRRLAERVGADRAWLGIANAAGEPISVCWPAPPPGEQESPFARCADVTLSACMWQGDMLRLCSADVQHAPLAAILREEGIADMIFMRGEEMSDAMIGFASTRGKMAADQHIMGGLATAFAAIRQALQRHILAEERLALERKLGQSRRMETIGAVATGVAHNFNNILGAISGFSEIAHRHTRPGSIVRRSLGEIQLAVSRAEQVVEEILSFGRPTPGKKKLLDPLCLVAEISRMFEASGQKASLTIDIISAPERLVGSFEQLLQLLHNVLNNAAQAGGSLKPIHLSLRMEHLRQPADLSHASLPPGQYVVIAIADEGAGIAPRNLPRLFEPFFTTRGGGTGLGLSTAWETAIDHGGTIDVRANANAGSVFALWLPVLRSVENHSFAAASRGQPAQKEGAPTKDPAAAREAAG